MSTDIRSYDQLFLRHNLDPDAHKNIVTNLQSQIDRLVERANNLDAAVADIYKKLGRCVVNELYFKDQTTGNLYKVFVELGNLKTVLIQSSDANCQKIYSATVSYKSQYIHHLIDSATGALYKIGYDSDPYVTHVNYSPIVTSYYVHLLDKGNGKKYKVTVENGVLVYSEITSNQTLEALVFNDDSKNSRYSLFMENDHIVTENISEYVPHPDYPFFEVFRSVSDGEDYKIQVDNNQIVYEKIPKSSFKYAIGQVNLIDRGNNSIKQVRIDNQGLRIENASNPDDYFLGLILSDKNNPYQSYKLVLENNSFRLIEL